MQLYFFLKYLCFNTEDGDIRDRSEGEISAHEKFLEVFKQT
jgi:hypothetical protein